MTGNRAMGALSRPRPLRSWRRLACGRKLIWAVMLPWMAALPGQVAAAPQPRGNAELDAKAEEVFAQSEWRQLRRQAESARQDSSDDRSFLDRCDDRERKPREPTSPRAGCEGCGGCSGCDGCGGVAQGLSGLMSTLTYLLLAALVGFLLWALIKHFSGKQAEEDDGADVLDPEAFMPDVPPGDSPASIYLREALALADAGDYRGALRQLLLGSMSWTERQGLIRFRRGLTNREYLRAIRSRALQRESMQAVVLAFEEVVFGRRPATRERFQEVLPDYRAAFEHEDPEPGAGEDHAALAPAS